MDDIKVYDQKLKELQSHIPFLSDFITKIKARTQTQQTQFLSKLEKLYQHANTKKKLKLELIINIEKAIRKLKDKYELRIDSTTRKTNTEIIDSAKIKKEDLCDKASTSESISETPDSPPPTRHYDRTSPIEIPTERHSDDVKVKKEKPEIYRYEDNRRHRNDRHGSHDKSDRFSYDSGDRYSSRYDQHERSISRDRFRRDRRDRSDSSERSRHAKSDRYRYEQSDKYRSRHDRGKEKYDPFENRDNYSSSSKLNERSDRGSGYKSENKYERSDRYSPVGNNRNHSKLVVNPISDSSTSVFNRLGSKIQSTIAKVSNDDRLTEGEASELKTRHSKIFDCDSDNEDSTELKNLIEVRTKLVTQIKIAEKQKRNEQKSSSTATSTSVELPTSDLSKISLTNCIPKTGLKFKMDSLKRETITKECTSTLSAESGKEDSAKFSFLEAFNQTSKTIHDHPAISTKPVDSRHIDDDIINKVTKTVTNKNNVASLTPKLQTAILQNISDPSIMDKVKEVLATSKMIEESKKNAVDIVANTSERKFWNDTEERLANKYNPKVRADQHSSDKVAEMYNQPDVTHSNNLQMVRANDPRLSRVRDPRVQAHQDSMRMQAFSPPPPPPAFIPNYPPIIQSVPNYNMNPYPKQGLLPTPRIPNQHQNRFATHPGQQHPYPNAPQYPIPSRPNLRLITPHMPNYNNQQRNVNIHHQMSPVSSTDVSPPVHYPYPPTYPEHNRNQPQPIQNKFRPALNLDNVERQKYEQSRAINRRHSIYVEKNETPRTYGEYRRSLQAVSSTSEKFNNETATNTSGTDVSKSHLDNAYRSGNFGTTPNLSVTSSKADTGLKFRIPKKKPNDAVKSSEIHTTENSKESDDEQASAREVRDSDDSECEVSGNAKGVINSDSEASESRDPRIRVSAMKKKSAGEAKNVKDSPSTEKQNDVVTSSTSLPVDNQSTVTKEDMESMLKQFMNPNNLLTLITLCGQASDDTMFSKIKDIIQRSNETNQSPTIEETTEKPSTSTEVEKNLPKTPRKKQRNELEKLNEDIRTMFISDGVVTATGRRMCAVYNSANKESAAAAKNVKAKKQENRSKDDVAVVKQTPVEPPPRIMRRRNTMVCYTEPSGRSIRPPAGREEEKSATPTPVSEPKIAKKTAKSAKATKPIELSDGEAEESPVKRVTRSRLTKECNIVLEKLHPAASVESLTGIVSAKKDGRGKRRLNDTDDDGQKIETLKKKRLSFETVVVKNNNPDWHCLNKAMEKQCQLCEKTAGISLVSHYVNCHPNNEVFPCRVAPDVAEFLRNSTEDHKVERLVPERKIQHEFKQLCYFCNEEKSMPKTFWINHIAVHTGYYQYKCTDCNRRFAVSTPQHACKGGKNKVVRDSYPQFNESEIFGYLCDFCNFIRFEESEMVTHLRCEHEGNLTTKFKKFTFLSFPKKKKKSEVESKVIEEMETTDIKPEIDKSVENKSRKRSKTAANLDNIDAELQDIPSEKVLRSRVVNSEAFIAQPKEDDGLFDRDTMKLMKDMSFSASKDAECSSRSNRTKSIAEKLNERFNSVQEDDEIASKDKEQAETVSLDPLACDEGISIVIKTQTDDDCNMEQNTSKETPREKTSSSTTTDSVRDNIPTPTDELFDESDDNWESYSSDGSEDESVVSVTISRPSNEKNVGIIDTIARLQQSISSQGPSTQVDGVDKSAELMPQSQDVKEEEEQTNGRTDSKNSKQQANSSTHSETEDREVVMVNIAENDKTADEAVLTYEAIVNEATRAESHLTELAGDTTESDVTEGGNVKTCVSNGRSSLGNYSFNLNSTKQAGSQLGSRNGNGGGSSSNADSTNNDVEMVSLNCPTKTLTRIFNIGYSSSSGLIGNSITFCCLIDDCGFETMDLAKLLTHIEDHTVEWYGFCMTCNAQVNNDQVPLMMEFKHMTEAHLNKKDNTDCDKNSGQRERTPFIKCKVLPGDKLSKLREAEIAAKAKQLTIQDATPSTSVVSEKGFMKIANVTSLTTAATTKPDIPSFVISNVVSLGATKQDYGDPDVVVLKQWARNPTLKLQSYCKRMMRDISLFSLYKCMDIKCAFTTNDSDLMLTHLRNHENNAVSQAKNVSDEDTPSYLECAYCDDIGDSCQFLVKHIQDEHQSSIFQCPYCFYRSCAAYNVVVHLSQFHQSEQKSVLVCNGKPKGYATEKALIEKSRQEFVRPLRCTEDCKKITFVMDYFVQHMKSSPAHSDKFKCQVCGYNVAITEAAKHLLCHRIGVFECVYCQFGTNDVESIQHHMCNSHPSKLLYICVRLMRKSQVLTDEQLSSIDSTLSVHLGQSVDAKLFQRCPYTEQQLSMLSPSIEKNANISEAAVVSVPRTQPTSSSFAQTPTDIEITAVTSISNETFSNPEKLGSSSSGLMLSEILSYKDFEKEYVADDYDKYFANIASPSLPEQPTTSKYKKRSSSIPVVVELPENKATKPSTPTSRTDLLQGEIDVAAYDLVKGTGLEGSDLYRCGFEDCDEKCGDILAFNVHLLKHNSSQKGFKCYHCSTVSKNIVGLKYHIKVHGIHRYFCYFCNHTSAIVNSVQKHMQDTHSRTHVNSIALNPKKVDQNKDMFIVCPRGLRQEELNRFGRGLMDRNKRKLATTKKFYSPDDIELLPRQAIFNDFIWCSLCDYSTKVRTNMSRHLIGHKDEKSVPKIDPVNPVPCLDTGEKHFDKMINLACSSNDGKTTQCDPAAFVPEGRRFVCNARQCQYQTISENMLKRHLTTLHTNEDQYKCPHCNTLICQNMDIDKVIFHLRMHDAKIYKCPKCTMVHHVKSVVEKHKEEVHVGCSDQIILVIRDENTSSTPTHSADGQPKVSKWKCALCNDLCATQKQIQAHVQTAHCIKFQYQCDICNEMQSNSKATMQEHMSLKHPNVDSRVKVYYTKVECAENDNAPIWRRDDPNKIKHIRGILFEEENVRKTTATKKDQTEVKKKTSKKKRPDKPVIAKNTDAADVLVINESESDSIDDNESNAIFVISDEDVETASGISTSKTTIITNTTATTTTNSNAIPSTSKNLIESGKRPLGSNINALTKVSDETTTAEVTSSGIKNIKESSLQKAFACGSCSNFSSNTIALVKAHQAKAHPMCNVFQNDLKDKSPKHLPDLTTVKPKVIDSISYKCFHCIIKVPNPQLIYKHWKENHKFTKITPQNIEIPSRPFMFLISKTFQCYHCRRVTATFNDLKVHSQRNHPKVPFTIIDNIDKNKCGVCSHQFVDVEKEIVQHFKETHKDPPLSSYNEPINFLTDEFLNEIIGVLPKQKVKCTHCNVTFFSILELNNHTKEKHGAIEMKYEILPNDPIMYGCPKCQNTNCSETAMIEHIRGHLIQYQCKFCDKHFDHLEMVKQHHDIMHKTKDETYRNIDVEKNIEHYLLMKIIFPNGLVLTKGEAKYTKYGSIDEVIQLVTELNEKDLEEVRQRQANNRKDSENNQPLMVKKKTKKRMFVLSDNDDSDHDTKASLKPKAKLKKRRMCSQVESDSDSVVFSTRTRLPIRETSPIVAASNPVKKTSGIARKKTTSSNSSEDEPLTKLIPYSFYGKKSRPVNLSKIFTQMQFGDSNIRVSCDRFALLVNMNPKLRLKRFDDP